MKTAATSATASGVPGRAVTFLYLTAAAVLLLTLLYNHYQVLNYPYPLDYNEPAVLTITDAIVRGDNPFSLENQPARTSVYPVMANLVAAPLTLVWGNSMFLHRLLSLVFILVTTLLVFGVMLRKTRSFGAGFVAAVFAYAGFVFYSTPISGGNGLGLLLFMGTVTIPWFTNFSRRGLAIALVLGVLAFYTKQYFMAGLGYVALYLFLARSKRAGVLFGLAFTALLLLTVPLVLSVAPYYFDGTFFPLLSAGKISSTGVMLEQVREYSSYAYPFYLVAALYLGRLAWRARTGDSAVAQEAPRESPVINLVDLDAPLVSKGVDYFVLCLFCSVFIFVFSLGRNPGNHLSYIFQLVAPFLVIVVIGMVGQMGRLVVVCQLLLLPAMYHAYAMQSWDFSLKHEKNWAKIQRILDESEHVYASNVLLERMLRSDLEIYQNSHTNYFMLAVYKPDFFKRADYEVSVDGIWERHVQRVHGMLRRREFDAVLLDFWSQLPSMPPGSDYSVTGRELLERYYEKKRKLPVAAANRPGGGTFGIEVWRPRQGEIAPAE